MAPAAKKPRIDDKEKEQNGKEQNGKEHDGKEEEEEHSAVTLFREYLRIKSVHPEPDYDGCLVFLRKQADRLGLPHKTTEMVCNYSMCTSSQPQPLGRGRSQVDITCLYLS